MRVRQTKAETDLRRVVGKRTEPAMALTVAERPKRDVVGHLGAIHSEQLGLYSVVEQHLGEG
jgi:hypothetical protein